MSQTPRDPAPSGGQLISLPIFWQVLGLSLTVLALALGINTLVVLKAPEPPPSGYSLREVVTALKTGEARLQNGHVLRARTMASAPDYVVQPVDHSGHIWRLESALGTRLAGDLGVPANTIWIKFAPHPFHTFWTSRMRESGPMMNGPQMNPPVMTGPGNAPGDGSPGGPESAPASVPGPVDMAQQGGGPGGGMGGGERFGPPPFEDSQGQGGGPRPFSERDPNLRLVTGEARTDIFFPSFSVAWKLPDGMYRVITPPETFIQPWQARLLLGFGLTALIILPLAWLLSRRLTRPIIAFSEAAAKVGFENNAPPVMAIGSREVRAAADVLNAMQARIQKQMEARTALMGAIAHDLKTPLARMRLRIEDLPAALRDKLSEDIAHMDGLIKSAMSFTSAHKLGESLRPLDVSALVEALSDDMAAVCPMEPARIEENVMVRGDTVALKRILTNLIENACRYAGSCRVELATRGDQVEISVIDEGPGLPPEMLETVFEPFYRLESSRNRDTGGSGLGLSVAKALAQAQGGTLTLINRYEGRDITGLEARLTLPRLTRTAKAS